MACDCSHMDPTEHEKEARRVACLLTLVLGDGTEPWIRKAAASMYGNIHRVHELTARLCKWCQRGETRIAAEMLEFTDNGKKWREMADWWQDHKQADQEKLDAEAAKEIQDREAKELAVAEEKRRREAQRIENIRARAERTKARNDQLRAARGIKTVRSVVFKPKGGDFDFAVYVDGKEVASIPVSVFGVDKIACLVKGLAQELGAVFSVESQDDWGLKEKQS